MGGGSLSALLVATEPWEQVAGGFHPRSTKSTTNCTPKVVQRASATDSLPDFTAERPKREFIVRRVMVTECSIGAMTSSPDVKDIEAIQNRAANM